MDRRFAPVAVGEPRTPVQPAGRRYSLAQLLSTYDAILDDMMPPSLLVNDRGELVHSFGGASRFLRPRDGRQELDVLDFVDGELKMVLVGGLKRALTDPSTIVYNGVRIAVDGKTAAYKVMIRRVGARNATTPNLLVSFEPVEQSERAVAAAETEVDLDQVSRQQLGALEAELAYTKENLQSAIEELETSNEELQASNEELQTSNEELQSTNEELQSVNEELYTVNAEYQRKIAELTELTNDMDNLLASTDVGTIFLDERLRIRKFTPQIAKIFDLVPHDIDRSIETFAHKVDHPELVADLKKVLQTGTPIERELRDLDHRSFFLRVLPYRVKGTVAGVVLTAIDVTVPEAGRGRAVPRAPPAQQPAADGAGRHLLQGRAGALHPRERDDGGAPGLAERRRGDGQDGVRAAGSRRGGRDVPDRRGRAADRRGAALQPGASRVADGGRGLGRGQPAAAARPRRTASWASSASSAT